MSQICDITLQGYPHDSAVLAADVFNVLSSRSQL